MTIKKTWRASSKSEQIGKGEELLYLAGRWGIGVNVKITKPFVYSQTPGIKRRVSKEIPDKMSLPSSIPPSTTPHTPVSED
jgi:hypothetical protein